MPFFVLVLAIFLPLNTSFATTGNLISNGDFEKILRCSSTTPNFFPPKGLSNQDSTVESWYASHSEIYLNPNSLPTNLQSDPNCLGLSLTKWPNSIYSYVTPEGVDNHAFAGIYANLIGNASRVEYLTGHLLSELKPNIKYNFKFQYKLSEYYFRSVAFKYFGLRLHGYFPSSPNGGGSGFFNPFAGINDPHFHLLPGNNGSDYFQINPPSSYSSFKNGDDYYQPSSAQTMRYPWSTAEGEIQLPTSSHKYSFFTFGFFIPSFQEVESHPENFVEFTSGGSFNTYASENYYYLDNFELSCQSQSSYKAELSNYYELEQGGQNIHQIQCTDNILITPYEENAYSHVWQWKIDGKLASEESKTPALRFYLFDAPLPNSFKDQYWAGKTVTLNFDNSCHQSQNPQVDDAYAFDAKQELHLQIQPVDTKISFTTTHPLNSEQKSTWQISPNQWASYTDGSINFNFSTSLQDLSGVTVKVIHNAKVMTALTTIAQLKNYFLSSQKEPGNYHVVIQPSHAYCFASIEFDVFLIEQPEFYVPNVFKPDASGQLNSYFRPFYNEKEITMTKYLLQVYGRDGSLLYESRDLTPGWNGVSQSGKKMGPGVYVYRIQYSYFFTGQPSNVITKQLSGDVTIAL